VLFVGDGVRRQVIALVGVLALHKSHFVFAPLLNSAVAVYVERIKF
jgi:hypothetical protein